MKNSSVQCILLTLLLIITIVERRWFGGGLEQLVYSIVFMLYFGFNYLGALIKERR